MREHPERAARLLHSASPTTSRRGYYLQLAAAAGWCSLPFLRFVQQPTLVLAGDDDPIIPLVNAKILERLIPRARLHVYSGGHLGILTESDALAPIVDQFLSDASLDG
jgi:pimeloyl-ACP methyl ester carboxylesterase